MIELLVICLKDHDSDFFPLYELALKLLAQIADAKKSPELKQQLVLGGYMQLMLVAFSQTELELPVVLQMVAAFSNSSSLTMMRVAQNCGLFDRIEELILSG